MPDPSRSYVPVRGPVEVTAKRVRTGRCLVETVQGRDRHGILPVMTDTVTMLGELDIENLIAFAADADRRLREIERLAAWSRLDEDVEREEYDDAG